MNPRQMAASRKEFESARNRAAIEDILGQLRGAPTDLLPFEDVRQKLRLSSRSYRGMQEVPLDQIIGSVGRYREFTRNFLPRSPVKRERWMRIDQLATETGMPPVELYKVGDSFFVLDGHHRISVARQAKSHTIEAHVREYQTSVPLEPDTTPDDLLIKAEYREFLDRTGLDKSRPEQRITFTLPGSYQELECQIALYRDALSQIDGEPFGYQKAAAYWYDMIYTSVVQIIQQRDMLKDLPHRTEADLFVWVVNHQKELSEASGSTVPMAAASDHVRTEHRPRRPRRFLRALKKRLSG